MRTSKHSKAEFKKIVQSGLTDDEKAEKLGISKAYMNAKAKKLGIKKPEKPKPPEKDYPVIVTETGTYTRSYITYSHDAVVKAKELRELVECNDTDYKPKSFDVEKMTAEEMEKEEFIVNKLKRNFGERLD